ncbi:MAG TPA: asparagine synthase (glutamine-hydrolyzing) [Steroidobacteraceae bacterium]|nr:asparagine synthase (glutamine-hydrolyzing) [Steroidobacteraceae bacterium]
MCGIAGIIGSQASLQAAAEMARLLRHRGPDGDGVFSEPGAVLAHRRLSILDLSDAGSQPMLHGGGVLTYNGELYNHRALRADLPGPWRSSGDTEVLLHLLVRDGAAALGRLVGMFAFGFWDSGARRLLLARDRLGIKPLYYRLLPDGIAFASELKALLVLGKPPIERSAMRDYLLHGYIPAPKTIYRGIAKLPAGHCLTWADGRVRIERWWQPSPQIRVRTAGETLAALDELLCEVVPAHTLSDVPVGVFLSGGIDSALTAYYLERPNTYTLGLERHGRSETDAARRVALHLQTRHTETTVQAADFEQALQAIPRLFDEPFGDSAAWSNYLIAQFARREVAVALSGEGGDEIFCGYPRYWSNVGARSNPVNRALARALPTLSRFGHSMQRRAGTGLAGQAAALGSLTAVQVESLLSPEWRESGYDHLWFYRQYWRADLPPLVQLRWLDLHTDLAEGLLTKVDRTSMAHSLEVRPPLLDHRLVEFMLSVDPALLVDRAKRRGKLLVRSLMEPRLPAGHLQRPKSGFGLPVHAWLKAHPRLLDEAVGRLMARGILQRPVTIEFRRAWQLLVLDRWCSAFA